MRFSLNLLALNVFFLHGFLVRCFRHRHHQHHRRRRHRHRRRVLRSRFSYTHVENAVFREQAFILIGSLDEYTYKTNENCDDKTAFYSTHHHHQHHYTQYRRHLFH